EACGPINRNRPERSVLVVDRLSSGPSVSTVTSASGSPLRVKTWPATAVTPDGAVRGGSACQDEYGCPSRSAPVQFQSSAGAVTRPSGGLDGAAGVEPPAGGGVRVVAVPCSVVKWMAVGGSSRPAMSMAPLRERVYRVSAK